MCRVVVVVVVVLTCLVLLLPRLANPKCVVWQQVRWYLLGLLGEGISSSTASLRAQAQGSWYLLALRTWCSSPVSPRAQASIGWGCEGGVPKALASEPPASPAWGEQERRREERVWACGFRGE